MAAKNTASNGQTEGSILEMIHQSMQEDGRLPSDFAGDYVSMLPLIDDFQHWIIDNASDLNSNLIFTFSVNLLEKSNNAECIKFAMSVLEIMDIEYNEVWRDIICALGLSDEFTLYSLFLIRQWPDANTVIFDLAKKLHGWGRIHAVERLSPDTQKIKDWLLTEGYKNDIMEEYSALTCVQKSGLPERLRKKFLTQDEFGAASNLIRYLPFEGPVDGISGLDNPEEFLSFYLAMAKGRGFSVAQRLGMDYADKAFHEIQNDFYKQYDLASLLLEDGLHVDETIQLLEPPD